MTDVVYNVASREALDAIAQQLGFWDGQRIVVSGEIPGGGSYFLNHVGPIDGQPGEWGRLRLNGETTFLDMLPPGAPLTVYVYLEPLGGWTHDGATLAPEFVGNVGMIA